jgi:putative flippase GtrA
MVKQVRAAACGEASPVWKLLFSPRARPLRFAVTGGLAGLLQLTLLTLLTRSHWSPLLANGVAFLLAAQLNFAVSNLFTWRDRRTGQSLASRWLAFHGSIASMAVVNLLVFAIVRTFLPDLLASATGILVAAVGNFFIGDRLVFRPRHTNRTPRGPRLLQRLPA